MQRSPPASAARSQWPRAAHSGLIHCTVQPGKYCTLIPLAICCANFSGLILPSRFPDREHSEKLPGFCASALVVSRENVQFLVVRLQRSIEAVQNHFLGSKTPRGNIHSAFTTFLWLPTIFASIERGERKEWIFMGKKILAAVATSCFLLAIVSTAHAQQLADGRDPNAPDTPTLPARTDWVQASELAENVEKPDKPIPQEQNKKDSVPNANPVTPSVHRFWDRENDILFAAVAAGRGLDYASTIDLRHRGINEAFLTNAIVDNHPLFAAIEIGATAASVGVSYVFHRTGHHRLERWTSAVHTGIAVGGAIRNYNLKSPN